MTNRRQNLGRLLSTLVLAALGLAPEEMPELPPAPTVAPPLSATPSTPGPPPAETPLRSGQTVTLRILQVIPADGLSPGERMLNGRNTVLPGDHFLAEVIDPPCPTPSLVGGSVTKVTRPGWFGRAGYVSLQLAQFVQTTDGDGRMFPWQVDTEDRRWSAYVRRALLSALLGLDGIGYGASIASNFAPPLVNSIWIGGGAAVGLLMGVGYSSFQRGIEASLEPGDTFRIVVGSTKYQPVPRDGQTILHPARIPGSKKGKGK